MEAKSYFPVAPGANPEVTGSLLSEAMGCLVWKIRHVQAGCVLCSLLHLSSQSRSQSPHNAHLQGACFKLFITRPSWSRQIAVN